MAIVELWLPALPPVPVRIGMDAVRPVTTASISSNEEIIEPVRVAEIMRTKSQPILFLTRVKTGVLRYSSSDGKRAAIFSKSSVVSSSMISKMSSIVTIPTSLFSLSTTGTARRS